MSWELPKSAEFDGKIYDHRWDYREILKLLTLLGDEEKPEYLRWYAGLAYFFFGEVPEDEGAMAYMASFLTAGETNSPGPRLYDWEQDAQLIAAGVNAVAGFEVRSRKDLHWWTFLGYFRAMGEGQFSFVVGIRQKLRRGQKLEPHELEYYRSNPAAVRLHSPGNPEKQRLEALLRQSPLPGERVPPQGAGVGCSPHPSASQTAICSGMPATGRHDITRFAALCSTPQGEAL